MNPAADNQLIVTIVPRGWAQKVISAAQEAGAAGATVVYGRGTGIHERKSLLGVPIQPEKEIVLTVVQAAIAPTVLAAVVRVARLDQPGTGIALVLDLLQVVGAIHLLEESPGRGDPG
jgi:nitrogen regulatory protein P-II 1